MIIFWCVYGVIAVLLILLLIFTILHLVNDFSFVDLSKFGLSATTFSVAVGLLTYLHNLKRSESKDYLDKSCDLLAKAYEILSSDNNFKKLSLDHGKKWESAALMIQSAEKIARRITQEDHIIIWKEYQGYWQIKFMSLLRTTLSNCDIQYFAEYPVDLIIPRAGGREPISVCSIVIIYRFAKGQSDLTFNEMKFTEDEISNIQAGGLSSLYHFLSKVKLAERKIQSNDRSDVEKRDDMLRNLEFMDKQKRDFYSPRDS